ncbi:MAG: hypothetical protein K2K87_13715 [Lachnospiraceae bacterium]|nr:hypothetical protein [Lachnospiraceae bacterium]
MIGYRRKQKMCIRLLAFCLFLSGCGQKQTGQELLNSAIREETDARLIVEQLLEKRNELMQTIGNFSSEEELLSALEEIYTTEEAGALYEDWLCEEANGLYEKSDDGALILKTDAQLPAMFDGYDVSILSYSEEEVEAYVIDQAAGISGGERSDYLETVELLSVTRNEQGFRLAACRSGAIYRDYFSEEGEEQTHADDISDIPSEGEAYDIVKKLYENWADYIYRFNVMEIQTTEIFTVDGHEGYVQYPSDSFSSMDDLLAQLGEIMTQGCVRQFQSIWLEREYPYYLEQDGVLYRYDSVVPEQVHGSAYAIVVKECEPESIHAFVIENASGENGQFRYIYELFLTKTAQGWRAGQIHRGTIDMEDVRPAHPIP